MRYREVPLQMSGKAGNFIKPSVSAEVFCRNFGKTPLKAAQMDFLPNMSLLPKFYRKIVMTNCLAWRVTPVIGILERRLPPRIPAPLAQTVRQGSMRDILDLLETWLITTGGFAKS